MSNSKKNGSSFSRIVEERFDLSTRAAKKQQEYKKGSRNFPNVFRPYLKERELDEDQLVSSKAKFFFSSEFV